MEEIIKNKKQKIDLFFAIKVVVLAIAWAIFPSIITPLTVVGLALLFAVEKVASLVEVNEMRLEFLADYDKAYQKYSPEQKIK